MQSTAQLMLWFDPSRPFLRLREMTPARDASTRATMMEIAVRPSEAVFCNRLLQGSLMLGSREACAMIEFHLPWLMSMPGEHYHELASRIGSSSGQYLRAMVCHGSIAVHVSQRLGRRGSRESERLLRKILQMEKTSSEAPSA